MFHISCPIVMMWLWLLWYVKCFASAVKVVLCSHTSENRHLEKFKVQWDCGQNMTLVLPKHLQHRTSGLIAGHTLVEKTIGSLEQRKLSAPFNPIMVLNRSHMIKANRKSAGWPVQILDTFSLGPKIHVWGSPPRHSQHILYAQWAYIIGCHL